MPQYAAGVFISHRIVAEAPGAKLTASNENKPSSIGYSTVLGTAGRFQHSSSRVDAVQREPTCCTMSLNAAQERTNYERRLLLLCL
jgi:hypothetical protein